MTRHVTNAVILTGADAALLYQAANLRALRVASRGKSERLYGLLTDITQAAFAHTTSVDGRKPQASAEVREAGDIEVNTVEQVARRAGITSRAVRNHIKAGLLEATMVNRNWVIAPEAADQYIAGRTRA
ncbi:helix-turn-helix domain-containing protein [Microbacterium sp. K24]|uniref:helix-turn-helix domain-containing protein n=1 Tax=Microbacterium sp. K24 TaxID=2305446 RepID=UPI00109C361E|nr:helix-turn-helix domain-containing protein [Microbacterium sp. K24]